MKQYQVYYYQLNQRCRKIFPNLSQAIRFSVYNVRMGNTISIDLYEE